MSPPAASINQSLQILRGLAALSVLLTHALITFATRGLPSDPGCDFFAVGVDVFFVISGYIMAGLVEEGGRGPIAAVRFLLRRASRLLPVYLLILTVQVVFGLMAGGSSALDAEGAPVTLPKFVAAAAMVPTCSPGWSVPWQCMPLLTVAWSLVFEWFFYIGTALAILLGLRRLGYVVLLVGAYGGIAVVHAATGGVTRFFLYPSTEQPMVLLFLAGIGVRAVVPRLTAPGMVAPAALLVAAMSAIWAHHLGTLGHATMLWSASAISAVLGFVALDRVVDCQKHAWSSALVALGNCSYSLYLVHSGVVSLAVEWVAPLAPPNLVTAILLLASVITVSMAVSVALYRWVERPCNRFLNRLSDNRLRAMPHGRAPKIERRRGCQDSQPECENIG